MPDRSIAARGRVVAGLRDSLRSLVRLRRFPGLLAAVVAGAVTLGVAGSAAPLFLSTSGGAALRQYMTGGGTTPAAATVAAHGLAVGDLYGYQEGLIRGAAPEALGAPIKTLVGEAMSVVAHGEQEVVRLMARTDAVGEVEVVERAGGDGVWIADYTAERLLGARAGDSVRLHAPRGSATVEVAGVYRDLLDQPPTPFWEPFEELIFPAAGADTRPPPFMLASPGEFFRLTEELGDDRGEFHWEYPLAGAVPTLGEGRRVASAVERFGVHINDPSTQLGAAFTDTNFTSTFPAWVEQAEATVASISGPIGSLALAGCAIALAGIAVVGMLEVRRRRTEFALLHARGVSPLRLGARAAGESLLVVAAGCALGWGLGVLLVRWLGPGGEPTTAALRAAGVQVAWLAGGAVLLLGAVAAGSVRSEGGEGARRFRQRAASLPWELLALGLAAAALYELVARGAGPVEGSDGAPQIDRLLLLFPILAIAGVSGLAARGLRRLLARSRGAGAHWPPAAYLAARRLSSFSRLTGVLVTSCAAALGTLLFSALLSTSIQATADQRAFVTVGSEVAVHTTVPPTDLREAPFDATPVVRISDTSVEPGADGSVDVLGIDPATFERGAGWDEHYASAPLDDLVARLGPGDGSRLPVLVAGEGLPGDELLLADLEVPVEVVGRARVWPGMVGERPVVVAASNALDAALETAGSSVRRSADGYEVWAQAPASEVVAALRREGVDPVRTVSAAEVRSTPAYLALSWMFGFLQSLGLAAGVVALVGAHLFLHSRQREAETSYALARRMGLRAAEHRASVALELGGMLLASLLIGAVAAYATAAAVLGRIDLGAGAGPIPLLRIPAPLVSGVAVVLALFTAVAAWAVQRRADRTNVAQVMRYAD